ncbi:MAG: hypothetical protein AB7U79_05485 [Candidatus Izemoplasmatales bacterium]
MKNLLKRLLRLVLLIVIIITVLILSINVPITVISKDESQNTYENWMSETLSNDQLIIDTAMLGAHDAFTSDMTFFSKVDESSADSIQTGLTGLLIKGLSYRQSKTQVSDITTLLEMGVRYFDMRLSFNEDCDCYMTAHTYFSTKAEDVLADLESFLSTHPGEFVILDIQHVNGVDYTDMAAFNQVSSLFSDADLENYMIDETKALSQITYGDITDDGTRGGLIVLTKFDESNPLFFSYQSSIRSAWANTDSIDSLNQFLDNEASLITAGEAMTGNQVSENQQEIDSLSAFRVMQGVLTMQMSVDGIIEGLRTWSLIERAIDANTSLIENDHFDTWLEAMPIVMVDYADSNHSDFLDKIMQKIIDFNENL